jgi:hypothetical protein
LGEGDWGFGEIDSFCGLGFDFDLDRLTFLFFYFY